MKPKVLKDRCAVATNTTVATNTYGRRHNTLFQCIAWAGQTMLSMDGTGWTGQPAASKT